MQEQAITGAWMPNQDKHKESLEIWQYARAQVPLTHGQFDICVYRNSHDETESIVISKGLNWDQPSHPPSSQEPVFVRVHSECFTGEVLGSLKCDCKFQLDAALCEIARRGQGLVIYLRQEGRGIGLGNKIKAYSLQDKGLNTIEANHALGFPNDLRDFRIAGLILQALGIAKIELNTNNPDKMQALVRQGIELVSVSSSLAPVNPYNVKYLQAKQHLLGHRLEVLDETEGSVPDHESVLGCAWGALPGQGARGESPDPVARRCVGEPSEEL